MESRSNATFVRIFIACAADVTNPGFVTSAVQASIFIALVVVVAGSQARSFSQCLDLFSNCFTLEGVKLIVIIRLGQGVF